VGRFAYDYQSKYFIESTYRYDGSSRFAPGKEWGLFPSLSLGWRLSEESFFESLKEVVPELKLRASIGTAGFDGSTSYEWLGGFNYSFFYATNNDGTILTIDNKSLPNSDITWETNTTYNVGLDATLFNRELNLSFDYFFRTREDVLAPPTGSIPNTLGVGVALQNLHEYSNEGFEISANYKKQLTEDLKITTGINYSKSREKAVFIDEALIEDDFQRSNLTVTGGFTGLRRGFISDGLFQSQEEIDNHPIQDNNGNSTIQPGDIKFKDLDGDGFVNDIDRKVYGQGSKAASNYSLNVGAEYKNFALSVLLTGASGYDLFISGEAQSPLLNAFTGYDYQMDYWTPENTDAAYPRISEGGSNSNNNRESDFWVRDGKHIRFKNINLSYTLPKAITKKTFDEVRFFVTGYNLFIIKDYDEDFDPQLQGSDQGWVYPQTKSITFGINVTL
ncbi:SusC/RagA family TonB-linked outer membrane protein, partial [Algibacter sp.]